DGNLTFGSGDGETAERSASRFLTLAPRIAMLYGDLDPSKSGTVSYRHDAPDSITITYKSVPLWGTNAGSTVAVTLDSTGKVTLDYGTVSGSAYIAGVSAGGAGNAGTQMDLASAGDTIGYGGNQSLYQVFGNGKAFNLASKKISFTTDKD